MSRAAETSHRLAEARARERRPHRRVSLIRESAERPTVTATAGFTRTSHVHRVHGPGRAARSSACLYPDVPNNYQSRLELRWPIYTGGRTDALERAARAEADAVGADVQAAQADLRLEVTRAYWAVVTAQRQPRRARTGRHANAGACDRCQPAIHGGSRAAERVVVGNRAGGACTNAGHRGAVRSATCRWRTSRA